VVKIDPVAKAWAEHILGFSVDGMEPGNRPDQVCHVIGLTDLPVKLMQKAGHPLPFFIKEPEKGLHPSQQVKIADWSAAMVNNTQEDGSFNVMPTGD
ncbi:MAG: hypothetical protein GWO20_04220, partial [Candidatus Korarchaeota archaeon]|nr:hypothetical protein [Candidatus Korarchaeota archaeon]